MTERRPFDGSPGPRDPGTDLSAAEKQWLEADEALWQRAHRIALGNPTLDVGDLYHTLRNFQRSPSERLRRGLRDGRARTRTV